MAKAPEERFFALQKKKRKYCDREGFLKRKINKRPSRSDTRHSPKEPCIKDCTDCVQNTVCTRLPFI